MSRITADTPRDALVALARSGDDGAIATLLARAQRRLESLTKARLGTRLRARLRTSDVVQSTYAEVLQRLPDFDGESEAEFVAWIAVILQNKIRRKGRYFDADKRRHHGALLDGVDLADSARASPSTHFARGEEMERVLRAVDRLPEKYRRVLVERAVDGRDFEEIAERTNATVAACRTHLWRARALLVERLGAQD